MKRSRTRSCAVVFLTLLAVGCEGKGPGGEVLTTVAAGGTVTYQGKPIESYAVTFHSPSEGVRPSTGQTDAQGKFKLGTNQPGDGAPPGKYKVSVAFNPISPLDPAIASPAEIAASTPKDKTKLPSKFADPEKSGLEFEIPAAGTSDLKIDLN